VKKLIELFVNNKRWAERMVHDDPRFFADLVAQQTPRYLWIGCSDSRVPANEIVGLRPGELFVHRNVANIVSQTDLNCLAVLQYAIDVLHVDDVIVCGHYGCGGVRAALAGDQPGPVGQWLRPIVDIREKYRTTLDLVEESDRANLLCELNVREQVRQVAATTVLHEAWRRGQAISIHGLIYGLHNGRLRDLDCSINGAEAVDCVRGTSPAAMPPT